MAQVQDFMSQERAAGKKAASSLRANFRSEIKSTFQRRSGALGKTTVSSKYRNQGLDRLTLTTPHYSFKLHFGSSKQGDQKETTRSGSEVKSFRRHLKGSSIIVSSFPRRGGKVSAHKKNETYNPHGHLSRAMSKSQSALETLASELAENRIIQITSKINF